MLYTTVDRVTPDADLSGYDLAWIHIDGESSTVDATFDVRAALKAGILTDAQIRRLKDYVSHGGGLVLTGLAPSIVKDLGFEKAAPGETYWGTMYTPGGVEMSWETWARCNKVIGLKPTDRAHPLFSNFAEPGFGLESYNESAIVTKSVWSRRKGGWPENGRVLAEYFSDGANIPSAFAVAVEYQVQAGKVLTLGDCFSPRLDESNAGGFISRWNTPYHAFLKNIVQTYRRSPTQPVEDQ
jgi:hypothetical protein